MSGTGKPVSALFSMRRTLLGAIFRLGRAVLRRPQLKFLARRLLQYFPSLRIRLHGVMYRAALSSQSRLSSRVQDDADLSPRTVRMLRALKQAAERRDVK